MGGGITGIQKCYDVCLCLNIIPILDKQMEKMEKQHHAVYAVIWHGYFDSECLNQ